MSSFYINNSLCILKMFWFTFKGEFSNPLIRSKSCTYNFILSYFLEHQMSAKGGRSNRKPFSHCLPLALNSVTRRWPALWWYKCMYMKMPVSTLQINSDKTYRLSLFEGIFNREQTTKMKGSAPAFNPLLALIIQVLFTVMQPARTLLQLQLLSQDLPGPQLQLQT
jgi:hypothetical protein